MGILYFSLGLIAGIVILQIYIKYEKVKWKTKFENEKRIFQLVESSKDLIYYYEVKPKYKFRYTSPSIEQMLGEGLVEKGYQNPYLIFELIHPDDYDVLFRKINGDGDYSKPFIQRWSDDKGQYKWFEEYATPIYKNGEMVAIEGILRDITEKVKLQQELKYQISHDALTGIYNRNYFEENMEKYNKHLDTSIAIILCDLDELKYMNDNYGHKKGDVYIQEYAKLLKQYFSDNTIVARIGGDEFAIIVLNPSKEQVEYHCEKLTNKISEYNINSKDIKIKVSMGYAFSGHSIGNMENLLAKADKNMYRDKNKKKSQNLISS
ncbi:sensor domain-containing diguanylate cyclase [Psychrobacillus sp. FSL H8-0483]|uniref:sensor domain-containing diguanylate cyclase n=1 Tax=Psychrobacillus sp. FSL H8-0483 TaxID=2921389 RepID=UPI00315AA163